MNAMYLMEAMTEIDAEIIENATLHKKVKRNSFGKVLLIAAVIASLAISVLAISGRDNWFVHYFSETSEGLSEEQIEYIEDNTVNIPQTQTHDGYTIAVESTVSDGTVGIIKLTLTAPEGVDLNADSYRWGNVDYLTPAKDQPNTVTSVGWDSYQREDQKNVLDIIFTAYGDLADQSRWTLRFRDFYSYHLKDANNEDVYSGTKLLARGVWSFDIVFSVDGNQEMELIKEPVKQIENLSLDKPYYMSVLITSIKLRAMSMDIRLEYLEPCDTAGNIDRIYIVMKDGSQVLFNSATGSPDKITYTLPYPIVLSEADYLLFADGTKLPIS